MRIAKLQRNYTTNYGVWLGDTREKLNTTFKKLNIIFKENKLEMRLFTNIKIK